MKKLITALLVLNSVSVFAQESTTANISAPVKDTSTLSIVATNNQDCEKMRSEVLDKLANEIIISSRPCATNSKGQVWDTEITVFKH